MRYCLYKYSIKTDIDAGDIVAVKMAFQELNTEIKYIEPVLEDMVARNILGKTDLWEFPQAEPGSRILKLSSVCTANLSYYPRYR